MGQTTWHPRTNFEQPKTWLLANGEIVAEPPLEQTVTGRKIRVAGTDMSAYSRDIDDLRIRAIKAHAERNQTRIWMPLDGAKDTLIAEAGFNPDDTKAELYVLSKDARERTIVWWRFKHPELPIEAILSVEAGWVNAYSPPAGHQVNVRVTAPVARPDGYAAEAARDIDGNFSNTCNASPLSGMREFIANNPPAWTPADLLGITRFGSERGMVEALLRKVRDCDELESIQIVDARDPDNLAWLDLELADTNVNANFLSDLTEYLEGSPTVAEALRIYRELQECLRGIGLVLEDRIENDFQKGLLGDEPDGVTVGLSGPHEEGHEIDHKHNLRMHLPTGTFIVDCHVRVDHNEVADRWNEALTIAQLSGEEDTLLAFARAHAQRGHNKRAKAIIRERKGRQKK